MAYTIVTDSSCNLTDEIIDRFGLIVLPLIFRDEKGNEFYSYQDNHKLDLSEFYEKMRAGTVFTTSLPILAEAEKAFRSILDNGKDILYIGFSSGLSGTYVAMTNLLDMLSGEYPDRIIRTVDTYAAAGGQGIIVWQAAKLAAGGASLDQVHDWVVDNRFHSAHWFTVEDLMYLFRGGRVSRSSAWAGNLLKVKPVLHMDNEGHLIPMEKVRGRKKSLAALVDHMTDNVLQPVENYPIILNHGDCLEEAQAVADMIRERYPKADILVDTLDPVIGAHTGPGLIALFFMAESRA